MTTARASHLPRRVDPDFGSRAQAGHGPLPDAGVGGPTP
jgi:hypothetical protein